MASLANDNLSPREKFKAASRIIYGVDAYPWQADFGGAIIDSVVEKAPKANLLVAPTGGGKSLVRDVCAVCLRGVSLTIVPLLSLGSDQTSKGFAKPSQADGVVTALHLDEMSLPELEALSSYLRTLPRTTTKTVFLFSSPQLLVSNPVVLNLVLWLLHTNLLRLVSVDELHLFAHFALSFRPQFAELHPILFVRLSKPNSRHPTVPVLLMTATCTERILLDAESLIGFHVTHLHWPTPSCMAHRNVCIRLTYSSKAYTISSNHLLPLLRNESNVTKKYVVYTNRRTGVDSFAKNLSKALDEDDTLHHLDIVSLVGTLTKEQKAHHIRTFVAGKTDVFSPRILVATAGAANAGLDDPHVAGVYRLDFPGSLVDMAQEKGRAGRYPDADPQSCFYHLIISFESFLYMYRRCMMQPADVSLRYKAQLLSDLMEVLVLLVLPKTCFQVEFEQRLSRPGSSLLDDSPLGKCGQCSFCLGESEFPPLHKEGVQHVLFHVFLHGPDRLMGQPTTENVVKAIVAFPCVAHHLFRSKRTTPEPPVNIKKVLLQLVAARILTLELETSTDATESQPAVLVYLAVRSEGSTTWAMHDDAFWTHIRQCYG